VPEVAFHGGVIKWCRAGLWAAVAACWPPSGGPNGTKGEACDIGPLQNTLFANALGCVWGGVSEGSKPGIQPPRQGPPPPLTPPTTPPVCSHTLVTPSEPPHLHPHPIWCPRGVLCPVFAHLAGAAPTHPWFELVSTNPDQTTASRINYYTRRCPPTTQISWRGCFPPAHTHLLRAPDSGPFRALSMGKQPPNHTNTHPHAGQSCIRSSTAPRGGWRAPRAPTPAVSRLF
jgi:hypothetical protein